jgi:ATP-dependent Clp protease ATP-binding subunit ClpA
MTSNIGSPIIQEFYSQSKASGSGQKQMEQHVLDEMKRVFRPEFLNRVDDTIIFHSLDEGHLAEIVNIQLQRVAKRLAAQNLALEVDEAARRFLSKEGYDPQFGARPLKRVIQEKALDPIARQILNGELKPGSTIRVGFNGQELVFKP